MCYTGTPSGEGVFFRNYRRKARGLRCPQNQKDAAVIWESRRIPF